LSQDVILDSSPAEQMIAVLVRSKGTFPTIFNRDTNKVFSKGVSVNKFSGSIKSANLK
jgi:hypothetical protein